MRYDELREDEKRLIDTFRKLNTKGKKRAFEYVDDATGVPHYRMDYCVLDKTGLKYKC